MSNPNNRTVFQRSDGKWVNKRNDATKATGVHNTQAEAWAQARTNLENAGGGELTVMGANNGPRKGQIVSKDTIGGGNDPRNIEDTEH